jgi:hypothetical protein
MRTTLKAAVATLAILAGGSLVAGLPAHAASDVTVQVNPGGVAFGYTDGYWDQSHQWHAWENAQAADKYRTENHDHYYAYKHDRDSDKGWRENDTWWSRH